MTSFVVNWFASYIALLYPSIFRSRAILGISVNDICVFNNKHIYIPCKATWEEMLILVLFTKYLLNDH